jgi:hypothetical protein
MDLILRSPYRPVSGNGAIVFKLGWQLAKGNQLMTIEAEIITPHLHGTCVTEGNRVHLLFVPTSSHQTSISNRALAALQLRERFHIGKRVSEALRLGRP